MITGHIEFRTSGNVYCHLIQDVKNLHPLKKEPIHRVFIYAVYMNDNINADVYLCVEQLVIENPTITPREIAEWLLLEYQYEGYNVFKSTTRGDLNRSEYRMNKGLPKDKPL